MVVLEYASAIRIFRFFSELFADPNVQLLPCNAQVARLNPERSIPGAVLKGAKGLAILTVAKAGMLLTYKFGSGLVVARRSDGSWSAPSAILSAGLGWGAQVYSKLLVFANDTLLQF